MVVVLISSIYFPYSTSQTGKRVEQMLMFNANFRQRAGGDFPFWFEMNFEKYVETEIRQQ
jgi:hypothetical protein